jgi:hypothetical protein
MTDGLQLVDLAARSSRFLHALAGLVADLEREQVVLRVVGDGTNAVASRPAYWSRVNMPLHGSMQ